MEATKLGKDIDKCTQVSNIFNFLYSSPVSVKITSVKFLIFIEIHFLPEPDLLPKIPVNTNEIYGMVCIRSL